MADDSYHGALEREARDLVAEAARGALPPIDFRDAEIGQVLDHLDAGRSVLVTGVEGVGKTAVIHGVAAAMHARGAGGLRQISTTEMMIGTRYLGEWQTKVSRLIEAAHEDGAVIAISDVHNLATVGKTAQDPSCLLDALRPAVEHGRVTLLGEATPEVLRAMQRVPGFAALFQTVSVAPLGAAQVDRVLSRALRREGLPDDDECRGALVTLTTRFTPARPQPGPALRLLWQVRDYHAQKRSVGEPEPLTAAFIAKVFSIYSGLPRFVVSRDVTMPSQEIRSWFQDRIIGQAAAIEAVVEAVALFKAGLHDPERPIGTFLFVGPTGVGKTELARAMATFLFGSPSRLLRFDLSEFKDYHAFEMLVGTPKEPERPARLVDPVRAQPFQVVLLDELEKAHTNVWDLLLQLLDEGRLTPPTGLPVSFRNTLVIATSNVGSREADSALGFGAEVDDATRAAAVRKALEGAFRPELLNRFQHTVVFQPLTDDEVRAVARLELTRILQREGITSRNLTVDVGDEVLDRVVARGYDRRYGARALKREIQRQIVMPIALALMEKGIEPGAILRVTAQDDRIQVRTLDTAESRAARREREPVKLPEGRTFTRAVLAEDVAGVREAVEALARDADEPFLVRERDRLQELRRDPDFWRHPEETARAYRDLDRYTSWLSRIERLREWAADLGAELPGADLRSDVERLARRLVQLEGAVASARRELVTIGARGHADALLQIRPLGRSGRRVRDLLVETYTRWAAWRQMTVEWLAEPLADDEPALLAVEGHCALGYLEAEAGVHRVREGDDRSVAVVRVVPWEDRREPPPVVGQRALKKVGQFGGRVRSRLECRGLVLQNARTIAENRELARELYASWADAPAEREEVARRYDYSPFKLRDPITGEATGRPDALGPRGFHRQLCLRIDAR